MVVVTFQEGLPVFYGDGVAGFVEKIQGAFDHGENDSLFFDNHARGVRGSRDFKNDIYCFGSPAFVVGPRALHGVNDYGTGMEMDLESCSQLRADEKHNLPGDRIQFDELYKMAGRPRDPRKFAWFYVAGERFASRCCGVNVVHGQGLRV